MDNPCEEAYTAPRSAGPIHSEGYMNGHRNLVGIALIAVALIGCKGVDLAALQTKATGLVEKYKPQVESGLTTVKDLLGRTNELPKDLPVVGGLVDKLTAQGGALEKVKGMLEGLPGQVASAAKEGKGQEDITKLLATAETSVGTELGNVTTALGEAANGVAAAEVEAKTAAIKAATAKLGETVGAPLAAQATKLDELITKAKALPAETAGLAPIATALDALKVEADKAKATVDGAAAKVEAAGADAKAAQAVIDQVTTEVGTATKKLETELPGLAEKLGALTPAPAADFAKALSTGFEVKGAGTGIEAQLIAFVEDATKVVDKTTWFNFDRLTFETGSTKIDVEKSKEQLANIVEILKAFPALTLKVGGYTDNDGSADANKKISQQRAEAVVAALIEAGIAKERLEAEGYGPEFPVCAANDTPECKAQNRRIAVRVTAK